MRGAKPCWTCAQTEMELEIISGYILLTLNHCRYHYMVVINSFCWIIYVYIYIFRIVGNQGSHLWNFGHLGLGHLQVRPQWGKSILVSLLICPRFRVRLCLFHDGLCVCVVLFLAEFKASSSRVQCPRLSFLPVLRGHRLCSSQDWCCRVSAASCCLNLIYDTLDFYKQPIWVSPEETARLMVRSGMFIIHQDQTVLRLYWLAQTNPAAICCKSCCLSASSLADGT